MEKYRRLGIKLTPQRLAILDYLNGNTAHPSAEDIYRTVSKKYPTMSFATVYNTLGTLRQQGHLRELTIDPNKKRFDPNPKPHHHLMCVRCKKTIDIHKEIKITLPREGNSEFEIIGHHIEFYGICASCKKTSVLSEKLQQEKDSVFKAGQKCQDTRPPKS